MSKSNYEKGEIIQCIKDTSAKTLFGDINNLDITTFIVSSILNIDYERLVGNITLQPLKIREGVKNEKLPECDVVINVKLDDEERIIVLEFNYFKQDLESFFKKMKFSYKERSPPSGSKTAPPATAPAPPMECWRPAPTAGAPARCAPPRILWA